MGRPALDISEHSLHGTTRRAATGESTLAGSLPRPPKDLSKEEKKRFRNYARMLAERRAVTAGDGTLLAILCRTESRCQQAQAALIKEGLVRIYQRVGADGKVIDVEKPNLHLKIVEVGERACVQILVRLGLTPRDRESVKPTSPVQPKNPPPPPDSIAGMDLELKRLRALQAEQTEVEQEPEESNEPDFDKILEMAEGEE